MSGGMKIFGVSLGAAAIIFIAGSFFWGGFNQVLAYTNTIEFCTSCHSMYENPYAEYQETAHYSNRSGVRTECSDCHVPNSLGPKLIRKLEASREVWHWMLGSIDTPEKFEEKRLTLAVREWERLKSSDSRECRSCHDDMAMNQEEQTRIAWRRHSQMREDGETCIDCHQGLAHRLPDDWEDAYDEVYERYTKKD